MGNKTGMCIAGDEDLSSFKLSEKSAWQQVKAPPVLPGKAGEKSRTVCQDD